MIFFKRYRFRLFFALSILVFVAACLPAKAQVVNIEKERKDKDAKPLIGFADLSLNYYKTNTSLWEAKNKLQLQYFRTKSTYLLFNQFSQVKADEKSYLNDGFLHVRYNYQISESPITAELFGQYQFNRIKKIRERYLVGAGPRIRLIDTTNLRSYIGPMLMYEYEVLTENEGINNDWRLSMYASFQFKISEIISFNHITYYQPKVKHFSDYRISSESTMNFKLTEHLSFKVLFNISYDTNPAQDVNKLFYTLSNGLSLKF